MLKSINDSSVLLLLHVVLVNVVGNDAVANVPVNVALVSNVLVGLYSFVPGSLKDVLCCFSSFCIIPFLLKLLVRTEK